MNPIPALVGLLNVVPSWLWALMLAGSILNGCHTAHQRDGALVEKANVIADEKAAEANRERVARIDAEQFARLIAEHGKLQTELSNANAQRAKDREASDRARAADTERLRNVVAAYAAANPQQGDAHAATCGRDDDRPRRLGGLLEEALELQDEGERLVRQRDDEVRRLLDQVHIDRQTVEQQ